MQIEYLDPAVLIPYAKNSKQHPEEQILLLMKGIETLGFDQPIVVGPDKVVIKGHGRLIAALRLGLDTVPVVVRDISATEAKFLRVADNEVPSDEWDSHSLRQELGELAALDVGFDLAVTGFTLQERDLLANTPVSPTKPVQTIAGLITTHTCGSCGYQW